MPRYLLDSDVLIWLLRGRPDTTDLVAVLADESVEPPACSALSVLEIWVGVKPGEEASTQRLFDHLDILPVDRDIARRAAHLLASRKRTSPRDWVDAVIAASAILRGKTLVTYNRKDYPYKEIALYPTSP